MESVKNKGEKYINQMPKRRILTTYINFDISVILFIILNFLLGIQVDLYNTLLAFTGWTSVGNSHWYIFVIIACYICSWVGHKIGKDWVIFILLGILYIILVITKDLIWYNTLLSYPAGILFSKYKTPIEQFIQKRYWIVLLLCVITFFYVHTFKLSFKVYGLKDNIASIIFALSIVIASMKIKVGNKALIWCGIKLFPLYIYQRISMIVLSEFDNGQFVSQHPYLYIWICFLITLGIAYVYRSVSLEKEKKV